MPPPTRPPPSPLLPPPPNIPPPLHPPNPPPPRAPPPHACQLDASVRVEPKGWYGHHEFWLEARIAHWVPMSMVTISFDPAKVRIDGTDQRVYGAQLVPSARSMLRLRLSNTPGRDSLGASVARVAIRSDSLATIIGAKATSREALVRQCGMFVACDGHFPPFPPHPAAPRPSPPPPTSPSPDAPPPPPPGMPFMQPPSPLPTPPPHPPPRLSPPPSPLAPSPPTPAKVAQQPMPPAFKKGHDSLPAAKPPPRPRPVKLKHDEQSAPSPMPPPAELALQEQPATSGALASCARGLMQPLILISLCACTYFRLRKRGGSGRTYTKVALGAAEGRMAAEEWASADSFGPVDAREF